MSVRKSILATAAVLAFTATGLSAANAEPAIPLNGDQETQAADPDGHGFFSYSIDGTNFCYTLSWRGLDGATAAHIHRSPRGVPGGIVIPLSVATNPSSACKTIDAALAAEITANPKAFYVNIHNPTFPAGAIRGQLK